MTDNQKLAYDYWDFINEGDWNAWANLHTPMRRANYIDLVSDPNNHSSSVGILTVNSAEVLSIEKVSNAYAPIYDELNSVYDSENDYECYLVGVNTQVENDNGYFYNGINYNLMMLVNQNSVWEVGGISNCPLELLGNKEPNLIIDTIDNYQLRMGRSIAIPRESPGYGLKTFSGIPSTISVLDKDGKTKHQNIDMTDFVENVTCNEVGTKGYNVEALRANAMAAKMAGCWYIASGQYKDFGYDIKHGTVNYLATLLTNATQTATVESAVADVDGWYVISDSKSGGKLFFTSYYGADAANNAGKGLGRLKQNGSNYLATNSSYKYDWKQIIHYYYDNSSYNNPTVGIVNISNK